MCTVPRGTDRIQRGTSLWRIIGLLFELLSGPGEEEEEEGLREGEHGAK